MVFSRGISVNKLVASKDLKKLPYMLSCLISSMKLKLSLVPKFEGICGESKQPRH